MLAPSPSLSEAIQAESRGEWQKAAKILTDYVASLAIEELDLRATFELEDRIGACYVHAASCSMTAEQFKEMLSLARDAYLKGSELFQSKGNSQNYPKASALYFAAKASLIKSWLANGREARKEFLSDAIRSAEDALSLYEKTQNPIEVARSSNQILQALSERIVFEPSGAVCKDLIERGMTLGKSAVGKLLACSSQVEKKELCRALYITSWLCSLGQNLFESEERRVALSTLSKEYWKESQLIVEELDDQAIREESAYYGWRQDVSDLPEQIVKKAQERMEKFHKAKDNLQIGCEYGNLIYGLRWLMVKEEDPRKLNDLLLEFEQTFHKMIQIYGVNSPVGIRCDVPAHCHAVRISAFIQCIESQSDNKRKRELLNQALEVGLPAFEELKDRSTRVRHLGSKLGTVMELKAEVAADPADRAKMLADALAYSKEACAMEEELEPFDYWALGTALVDMASIQYKKALLEEATTQKIAQIQEAVKTSTRGISLLSKANPSALGPSAAVPLAYRLEKQSRMNRTMYDLTKDTAALTWQLRALETVKQIYESVDFSSRLAETFWEMGDAHSILSDRMSASTCYERASKYFLQASERFPQIQDYYKNYSLYMKCWASIELARQNHHDEEYVEAAKKYEEVSKLLSQTKLWSSQAPFYKGCGFLEEAESLSSSIEPSKKAVETFQESADFFEKAHKAFDEKSGQIGAENARADNLRFSEASILRSDYCRTRILLEEARIAYKDGRLAESEKHYSEAKRALEKTGTVSEELRWEETQNLQALALSCSAWAKMIDAEARSSPMLYGEAAELFAKAGQSASKEKAVAIFAGNAKYAEALLAGNRFKERGRIDDYTAAKSFLLEASNCYSRAGFPALADWFTATERMFDAFVYIINASREIDPERRRKNYQAAEKILETSAIIYEKSGYVRKRDEVLSLLKKIKEERNFALSLEEILVAPTIQSGTLDLRPTVSDANLPEGLSEFEAANVQIAPKLPDEIEAGKEFQVTLDLINTGKQPALLLRVENLLPIGLASSEEEKQQTEIQRGMNDKGIYDLGGKRLPPLKIESVTFRATATGEMERVSFNPKVIYSDSNGVLHNRFLGNSLELRIRPATEFKFANEKSALAFNYLVDSFVKDYMIEKIEPEKAGWRTLSNIAGKVGLSGPAVYGERGTVRGLPVFLNELLKRGLVETRIFHGERGRGGEVTRVRVAYERDAIRLYINQKVRKQV